MSDNETKGWSGAITMAVQQLGPDASRAGARRARALAARAGGPTAALVALSTVTVTSLVAIAFAPLPHSVSPVAGGGVAAPTNVRSLNQKPSQPPPPVKKPGTGSAFTGNPPAAGKSTGTRTGTTSHSTGGGGTGGHTHGHGNTGGGGTGGGGTGGRPTGGGTGVVGGGTGGTGTEGQGQLCPPQLRDTPLCASPGTNFGGGGHIIIIPPPPVMTPVTGGGEGSGTQGTGSPIGGGLGTKPGAVIPPITTPTGPTGPTGGDANGSGESGGAPAGNGTAVNPGSGAGTVGGGTGGVNGGVNGQASAQAEQIAHTIARALGHLVTTKPNGHVVAAASSTPASPATIKNVKSTAKSVNKSDLTTQVKAEYQALVGATTTATDDAATHDSAQADKHIGKHRTCGEHRAGGKHRA